MAKGDLVLATARNEPRYVFLWLAATYLGAIHVAVDPSTGRGPPGRTTLRC